MYKSKLHEWLRKAHKLEQETVAKNADVKLHYMKRLARRDVPDPGLYTCRRIVAAITEHNLMQPDNRLPEITLEDL